MRERESLLQTEVGWPPLSDTAVLKAVAGAQGELVQRESTWMAKGSAEAQRASEAAAVQDQVSFTQKDV